MSNGNKQTKREIPSIELAQELEAARRLVKSLKEYLENLRIFKKCLREVNANSEQLIKVNLLWIDIVNNINDIRTVPYAI
ncbi:unnamed protein product, partial [Brenthis ino]